MGDIFHTKAEMQMADARPEQRMGMTDPIHPAVGDSITPVMTPFDAGDLLSGGRVGHPRPRYDALSVNNLPPMKRGCHY